MAVIECEPTEREERMLVALPLTSVTGEPEFVPSTLNCTVPLGVPGPAGDGLTVATKETSWPNTDGLADEVTVVVVLVFTVTTALPVRSPLCAVQLESLRLVTV